MIIRPYEPRDRNAVRRISVESAFMGESAAAFIDAPDIMADALTVYFTDVEPEACLVAEEDGVIAGYAIGVADATRSNGCAYFKIYARILWHILIQGVLLKKRTWQLLAAFLRSFLRGEFFAPNVSSSYPATLHINLDKKFRSKGTGSSLMSAFLRHLRQANVRGVCLASMSKTAFPFFEKHGFVVLHRSIRSYFRHITGEDIELRIYGMRLDISTSRGKGC